MAGDEGKRAATQRRQTIELPSGKKLLIAPLVLRDYATIEEECLRDYKKKYMQTVNDNIGFLPEHLREAKLLDEWENMKRLTSGDLPKQRCKAPVVLQNGTFARDPKDRSKLVIQEQEMPYEAWWLNNTAQGKLFAIWLSLRKEQPEMTSNDVDALFADAQGQLMDSLLDDIAESVGGLSEPTVGNGPSSSPEAKAG